MLENVKPHSDTGAFEHQSFILNQADNIALRNYSEMWLLVSELKEELIS